MSGGDPQSSSALKKGIASLNERISEHENKIANPTTGHQNWNNLSKQEQDGLIRHWNKEISNFKESVSNREEELKKRGDL